MIQIGDIAGINFSDDSFDMNAPHILTFQVDERGFVSSTIDNRKVYRDKSSEMEITAGSCWICSLSYNNNGNNYFAKGLRIIDVEDLLKMDKNLLGEMADYLLDYAPAMVSRICMPSMESKIEEMAASKADELVKAKDSQIESMMQDLESRDETISCLNTELEESRGRCDALESELSERDAEIEGLEAAMEVLRKQITDLESSGTVRKDVTEIPTFAKDVAPEGVVRVSKDELCSRILKDGRYRVRFSINGRRMTITEDEDGETYCRDNTIRVPNLESLLPFDGQTMMIHKEMSNGMTVSLL